MQKLLMHLQEMELEPGFLGFYLLLKLSLTDTQQDYQCYCKNALKKKAYLFLFFWKLRMSRSQFRVNSISFDFKPDICPLITSGFKICFYVSS